MEQDKFKNNRQCSVLDYLVYLILLLGGRCDFVLPESDDILSGQYDDIPVILYHCSSFWFDSPFDCCLVRLHFCYAFVVLMPFLPFWFWRLPSPPVFLPLPPCYFPFLYLLTLLQFIDVLGRRKVYWKCCSITWRYCLLILFTTYGDATATLLTIITDALLLRCENCTAFWTFVTFYFYLIMRIVS